MTYASNTSVPDRLGGGLSVKLCPHGHALTPENTYIYAPTRKVYCRTCHRERATRYRSRLAVDAKKNRTARLLSLIPELTENELCWAAGLFEGEGTVTITGNRKNYTRILVSVTSTDREVVEFFRQRWPIPRLRVKSLQKHQKARPAWIWSVSCLKAVAFLLSIRDYVRTNRVLTKIALALKVHESKRQGNRGDVASYRAAQTALRMEMKELNRRGTALLGMNQ